jgi:hypothetical protein
MTVSLSINPDPAIARELHSQMSNVISRNARTGKEIGNLPYTKGTTLVSYSY